MQFVVKFYETLVVVQFLSDRRLDQLFCQMLLPFGGSPGDITFEADVAVAVSACMLLAHMCACTNVLPSL